MERRAIETESEERSLVQMNEVQNIHDHIVGLAYDVEEMRRT